MPSVSDPEPPTQTWSEHDRVGIDHFLTEGSTLRDAH